MRLVRLRHPATGGEYDAPESAVGALAMSGWVRADAPSPAATESGGGTPEPVDPVPAVPEPEHPKTPRGRRKTEED